MLSYQHMYHAGSLADVHKHILLARALTHLTRDPAPLLYAETHAGRGRYNLDAPEARKTGEAAAGIDTLLRERRIRPDEPFLDALKQFQGKNRRLYPGSPALAAQLLRRNDTLWLWELHPREHAVLARLFAGDRRVHVFHANGQIGLPLRLPPKPPAPRRGLLLIDPSYEIKDEYDALPAFVRRLRQRWPQAAGLLWYPMLPAGRHTAMVQSLTAGQADLSVHEAVWSDPGAARGLYGSGAVYWGIDPAIMAPATFGASGPRNQD
jgi:23S rRNA (adenine2030-N6)-methyltransferase